MPFKRFLPIYAAARTLRYSLVAWLAVLYGRHVVRLWSKELDKWSTPLLYGFFAVMVGGIAIGIWQFRKNRQSTNGKDSAIEPDLA
jgi:membrane protein DedA with SNARE-associated domain